MRNRPTRGRGFRAHIMCGMKFSTFAGASAIAVAAAIPAAQSKIDPTINDRIRLEGTQHSQVMRTLHYLADVYGPRVTGSPSHKAAAEWAVKTMTGWGMQNGKLEPWEFGYPGWANEHLVGARDLAVQGRARRRSAGVDAGNEGDGQSQSVQPDRAGRSARESGRAIPRRRGAAGAVPRASAPPRPS